MKKEKFIEQKYEYREKLRLIQELANELNEEFNLEGENRIFSTPDMLVIPIIHKDNKRVEHAMNLFKTEKQYDLKVPTKEKKDSPIVWISASDLARSFIKFGPEFDSKEDMLNQKCLEKLKKEQEK